MFSVFFVIYDVCLDVLVVVDLLSSSADDQIFALLHSGGAGHISPKVEKGFAVFESSASQSVNRAAPCTCPLLFLFDGLG